MRKSLYHDVLMAGCSVWETVLGADDEHWALLLMGSLGTGFSVLGSRCSECWVT